jgi:hypothetical protein
LSERILTYFSDLDETIREAYLLDVAVPESHNLHGTITEKPQQYTDLREETIRI